MGSYSAAPRWVADQLDCWADTTIRRLAAGGDFPHASQVVLQALQDTPDAGKEDGRIVFTGREQIESIRRESPDRLAHKRGRTVRELVSRFDEATLGKYQGTHLEHRILGSVHGAYTNVERVLREVFVYAGVDAVPVARVALLMRYPERGPNSGIRPWEWSNALKAAYPDLWARLGRQKGQTLHRLAANIESVIRYSRLPDSVDAQGFPVPQSSRTVEIAYKRAAAVTRCRKAIGIRVVSYAEFRLFAMSVHANCVYFSRIVEEIEANSLETAS